jgi:hypothetical protein
MHFWRPVSLTSPRSIYPSACRPHSRTLSSFGASRFEGCHSRPNRSNKTAKVLYPGAALPRVEQALSRQASAQRVRQSARTEAALRYDRAALRGSLIEAPARGNRRSARPVTRTRARGRSRSSGSGQARSRRWSAFSRQRSAIRLMTHFAELSAERTAVVDVPVLAGIRRQLNAARSWRRIRSPRRARPASV